MPKAKPKELIAHRIELQESERDALDSVATSMALKNVTASINNLISPFFNMTPTSGIVLGGIVSAYLIEADRLNFEADLKGKAKKTFGLSLLGPIGIVADNVDWSNVWAKIETKL